MTVNELREAITNIPGDTKVWCANEHDETPAVAVTFSKRDRALRVLDCYEISVGEKILWNDN
jgi:hypothetical protein